MDDLHKRLIKFNSNRLADMVQLKYEAMTENVFRFFRGTCHLFYEDLQKAKSIPASPVSWICGDLHLENYGSYKADNKLVYFDQNDFDEALKAPVLWEIVRLLSSIFLAFYTLDIDQDQAFNLADLFVNSYAAVLHRGKSVSIEPRTANGIVRKFLKNAERSGYHDILDKRTEKKNDKVFLSLKHERHFRIEKGLKKKLSYHINSWIKSADDSPYNYEVADAVFRLAGTGSIGVKRYLILLKSTNVKNRFLIIDMKQSFPSSLYPFVKENQPRWKSEAHRIITIQSRMQNVTASLLSSTIFNGEPYVIQELQPTKDTLKFKLIRDSYRHLYKVIDDMALLTASSHLRSGGIGGSATIDELMGFASRRDEWKRQIINYAASYAQTVSADYRQFKKDHRRGLFDRG